MLEYIIKPAVIGLLLGGATCVIVEIIGYYEGKKIEERTKAFFEALDRKHRYCCEGGRKDKSISDFIREVERESIKPKIKAFV